MEEEKKQKIQPKVRNYYVDCNPNSEDRAKRFDGVDWTELTWWVNEENIKRLHFCITEITEWPREPMRNFFHGVIVPAFQEKLNECHTGDPADGKKEYWNRIDTKKHIVLSVFGMERFLIGVSTEALTPYEYHDMINAAELIYFNRYQELYDITEKPKKPTPFDR
jgi:hypothetical protein